MATVILKRRPQSRNAVKANGHKTSHKGVARRPTGLPAEPPPPFRAERGLFSVREFQIRRESNGSKTALEDCCQCAVSEEPLCGQSGGRDWVRVKSRPPRRFGLAVLRSLGRIGSPARRSAAQGDFAAFRDPRMSAAYVSDVTPSFFLAAILFFDPRLRDFPELRRIGDAC
jgi:hypothetical protein